MMQPKYGPSPDDFVREQIDAYERSGGVENLDPVYGRPVIIVHTVGVKTGLLRKIPLIRVEHEGRYLLVGSIGGAPKHPSWVFNLDADPSIRVQDGPEAVPMTVRLLAGDERREWWERAVATFPYYADYEAATAGVRDIKIYLAERPELAR